jgi:RNA polymerase sigma-70 factor (ECF subfamily)
MSRFDALIGPHIAHLRRYARALTGDVARADDLVQDTLERAWIKFHPWQPALRPRPWLFTIMHDIYENQVRTSTPRSADRAADEDGLRSSASPNQADRVDVNDLLACLDRLPPEQREVLLLVSLESLSYTEVGRILGITVGTVISRLARARTRLRSLLEGGTDERGFEVVE